MLAAAAAELSQIYSPPSLSLSPLLLLLLSIIIISCPVIFSLLPQPTSYLLFRPPTSIYLPPLTVFLTPLAQRPYLLFILLLVWIRFKAVLLSLSLLSLLTISAFHLPPSLLPPSRSSKLLINLPFDLLSSSHTLSTYSSLHSLTKSPPRSSCSDTRRHRLISSSIASLRTSITTQLSPQLPNNILQQ